MPTGHNSINWPVHKNELGAGPSLEVLISYWAEKMVAANRRRLQVGQAVVGPASAWSGEQMLSFL